MSIPAKTIHEDEFFYGHKACAGCGGSLAVRIALKVLGERSVAVLPAGCMSAVGFNFPQLCFGNNAIISTFAGTASIIYLLRQRSLHEHWHSEKLFDAFRGKDYHHTSRQTYSRKSQAKEKYV